VVLAQRPPLHRHHLAKECFRLGVAALLAKIVRQVPAGAQRLDVVVAQDPPLRLQRRGMAAA
jgi:hypothetical protein